MQKNSLNKIITLIAVLIFLSVSLIIALSVFEMVSLPKVKKEAEIKSSANSIAQFFSSAMSLERKDITYLLYYRRAQVLEILQTESKNSDSFVFITDSNGKIILASASGEDLPNEGDVISEAEFHKIVSNAKSGEIFVTDFGGMFKEDQAVCGITAQSVLAEYKNDEGILGMIFISVPENSFFSLTKNATIIILILSAAFFSLLILLCLFIKNKIVVPIYNTKKITEKFHLGDYNPRIPVSGAAEISAIQNDINEMAQKLESIEDSTDLFISNLSHDMRTPMTAIDGYIQMMIDGIIGQDKMPHYLGIIHEEVNRLSRRVTQLLEMSRMKSGKKQFTFEEFNLCEIARMSVIAFESRITEKHIDVEFSTEKDRTFVVGDVDAIQQVIYNLIDNAIKFTPENGVISFDIRTSGEKAFFAIQNTGEGIPPEELPMVFDRFYKSDRSRELDKKGTGLGLFICKSVIQAHGEDIWVTSEYKKFCKFVFSLPLKTK